MKTVDEGVCPKDHYSKNEIAAYEGVPAGRMAGYARDTVAVLEATAGEIGFADLERFAPYYNSYKNGLIGDKTVNYFYWHGRLAPFAHLFKLFVRRRKAQKGGNVHLYYDFGVKRALYDRYKQDGSLPAPANRGKMPKYGAAATREKRSKVLLPGGGRVDVPQNEIWRRFTCGINAANASSRDKVTAPEMVLRALQEYMAGRPALFDTGPVDVDESKLARRDNRTLTLDGMDPAMVRDIYLFIQRHNSCRTPAITLRQFMEAAARAHLERMPVELVAPEVAAELRAMENEVEEHG